MLASKITFARLLVALLSLCGSAMTSAATATLDGAIVTRVSMDISTLRGPNGRAFLTVDRHFTLPGVCLYAGAIDAPSGWLLEFPVEHPAFKSFLALALTAYSTGRSVRVEYDDGFGASTNCRITNLEIKD